MLVARLVDSGAHIDVGGSGYNPFRGRFTAGDSEIFWRARGWRVRDWRRSPRTECQNLASRRPADHVTGQMLTANQSACAQGASPAKAIGGDASERFTKGFVPFLTTRTAATRLVRRNTHRSSRDVTPWGFLRKTTGLGISDAA